MDAVILAAGKGSRLEGVMAPYHKPLMVINGRSVIWTAVRQALDVGANVVTVVASPANAIPISEVLKQFSDRVRIILQMVPRGPGDALYEGLEVAHAGSPTRAKTLVMMGDNISTMADVHNIAQVSDFGIGVQEYLPEQAARFTRFNPNNGLWIEGEPLDPFTEMHTGGMITCWVGPFVCPSDKMMGGLENVYRDTPPGEEIRISPAFNTMGLEARHIPTTTVDIGTPETVHGV